jgi:hypothetical protein
MTLLIKSIACLESLFFLELHSSRDRISHPLNGTNQWIFQHRSFKKWARDESGILWIQGNPGTGKSTLAKTLSFALPLRFPRDEGCVPGPQTRHALVAWFFYQSRAGTKGTSHKLMLRSLLYQILEQEPHLFEAFLEPFQRRRNERSDQVEWSSAELEHIFMSLAVDPFPVSPDFPRRKIHIIVDAIEDSDESGRRHILSFLSDLCSGRGKNSIKIVIFSRLRPQQIDPNLKEFYGVEVQRENQADIERIVSAGMLQIRTLSTQASHATDEFEDFGKYLLTHAQGVIL